MIHLLIEEGGKLRTCCAASWVDGDLVASSTLLDSVTCPECKQRAIHFAILAAEMK